MVRPPSRRAIDDETLTEKITACFDANYSCYGYRKICAQLAREGVVVGSDRCRRLMRTAGIQGARRGKKVRTTRADPTDVRAPDLVERDFTASGPDELWVTDFTYCSTWQGWVYVAFVLDVYSRRIVGWNASRTMTTELTLQALEMAVWKRNRPLVGLKAHSDAGSQYTALRYTERLAGLDAAPSIGTVGDSYDNAMAESLNGIYKTELVKPGGPWKTTDQLEYATFEWVDWYNTRRLHQQIGMIPPAEKEAIYYASNHTQNQPVLT
jgi:putative transposase